MCTPILQITVCVATALLFLAVPAQAAKTTSAASSPTDPLTMALSTPMVSPDTVLEEVRQFIEARVVRMPEVKSAEAWQQAAQRLRRDMLDKVVLRGEAARWAQAEARVEWLDTVPGGAAKPAGNGYPAGGGYTIRKLRFEALPGMWIPALLYVPDKLEGHVPVVLNVNGHEPKGKAVDYKQIRCINQARRGMIALNPEWFNMGQLKGDGFVHYRANQLDLCGTSAVAPFYLSMKRCLDILLALPNADPNRVAVTGLSGGGWQTIFISALDERVTLANPVAGYSSYLTRARYPSDLGDTEQTPSDMGSVADYIHLTAMRAPRPTLLTFNSKDNCCFASDHALQPLLDAARPIFALCGAESGGRAHVNDDPGTHNIEQDNRQQLFRMIGDHFYAGKGFDWHEIPCADEIKTAEQFNIPLPDNNENFNTLARRMLPTLPRRDAGAAGSTKRREQLRGIVHFKAYEVTATSKPLPEGDTAQYIARTFRLGNEWTVPGTAFAGSKEQSTVLVMADAGRKTLAPLVREFQQAGHTVVAVDPFYFGESTIPSRDQLHAITVAGVGERPLGIQAGQIASIARWLRGQDGHRPVVLAAVGPRTSTIALIAAACEPEAIASVELHEPLTSLKRLIETNESVEHMPELFCFGLLEAFDIADIAALIAPRPIKGL